MAQGEELLWLPPHGGDHQRLSILRALALVKSGKRPLTELLQRASSAFKQHTSLVIVTPAINAEWTQALLPLQQRGVVPTVLLLDPASFGGHGDANKTTASLADLGVTYYVITHDLLDRPEARPGQGGKWEWRVLPTGHVVPTHRPRDLTWKKVI